jgi:hypothetical protein
VKIKLLVATLMSAVMVTSVANAATPTPKPKAKVSTKATPKPTAKSTVKATPKPTTTKKVTKKPVVKKKKKVVKKTATPIPSPSPVWPPSSKLFTSNKGVYAKIPTGKELIGIISAKIALATDVKKCETNACGAVIIAADYTCKWWEIKAAVTGANPNDPTKRVLLGNLRTTYPLLAPKTYANVLLISDEPIYTPGSLDPTTGLVGAPVPINGISVGSIAAICHKAETEEKLPSNTYTKVR